MIIKVVSGVNNKGSLKSAIVISLTLLVLGFILIPRLPIIYDSEYHPDEGVWVAAGHYAFQKFFIEQDWSYSTWQEQRFGNFSTDTPVVGKYIIGASLYLQGLGKRYKSIPGYDDQPFDWDNVKNRRPPEDVLSTARRGITTLTILCCILFFVLTRELSGSWLVGLCSAILFIFDPLVLQLGRSAMLDIPVIFFSFIALIIALYLYTSIYTGKWSKAVLWSVGLGISCGLALGTKLNTLLIPVVCILWGLVNFIWLYLARCEKISPRVAIIASIKTHLICMVDKLHQDTKPVYWTAIVVPLSLLIAATVFWATNPFLYTHPVQNTQHVFEHGQRVANFEVPEYQRLDTLVKRGKVFLSMGLMKYGVFYYWLKWHRVDVLLAGLGGLLCVFIILMQDCSITLRRNYSLFLIWFSVTMAGIIYWVPFNWPRYYIPMKPIWIFLEANGIVLILLGIRQACEYISQTFMSTKTRRSRPQR